MTSTPRDFFLGELVGPGGCIQTGPFGSQLHSHEFTVDGTHSVAMPSNMVSGRIDVVRADKISDEVAGRLKRHIARPFDILLSRRGDIGRAAFVRPGDSPVLCGTGSLLVRLNSEEVDPFYAFLYLTDGPGAVRLRAAAVGSTMPNINSAIVAGLRVQLPNIKTQRKVAAVLSAYDDLVENNRRRIDALEEVIHIEFARRFDRVLSMRRGEERPLVPFVELVEVNPRVPMPSGQTRYLPMDSLSTRDMTLGQFETRARPTGARFKLGDTLMARITPSLENGKTGYVYGLPVDEVACGSTEFIVMRGKTVSPEYTYCLARSEPVRSAAIGSMSGASGRQRVSIACFDNLDVISPLPETETAFAQVVRPMFKLIQSLADNTKNLATERELILPKLISGAQDVSELDIDTSRIEEQEALWRGSAGQQ